MLNLLNVSYKQIRRYYYLHFLEKFLLQVVPNDHHGKRALADIMIYCGIAVNRIDERIFGDVFKTIGIRDDFMAKCL